MNCQHTTTNKPCVIIIFFGRRRVRNSLFTVNRLPGSLSYDLLRSFCWGWLINPLIELFFTFLCNRSSTGNRDRASTSSTSPVCAIFQVKVKGITTLNISAKDQDSESLLWITAWMTNWPEMFQWESIHLKSVFRFMKIVPPRRQKRVPKEARGNWIIIVT